MGAITTGEMPFCIVEGGENHAVLLGRKKEVTPGIGARIVMIGQEKTMMKMVYWQRSANKW